MNQKAQPISRIQDLFENIWFLFAIGTVVPTVFYTIWSLVDLVILPQFKP